MKILRILGIMVIMFFLAFIELNARIIYVDQTLSSNCTSGNYSIQNRNCSGNDGNAYRSIQAAVTAMSVGDTIMLRGGEYAENYGTSAHPTAMELPISKNGDSWESGHFNTITSFPGEWAILNGNGQYFTLGRGELSWDSGYNALKYWVIENLEVKNGASGGIGIHKGPVIIRHCYIHDNGLSGPGDSNRGGIHAYRLENSIIEYNYFYNNSGAADNNKTHIIIFADYLYYNFDINNCNKNNEIRYNLFDGSFQTYMGIKDKASQTLGSGGQDGIMEDMTNKNLGNRYHHNIFLNTRTAIMGRQDFEQIYNNISVGGKITGEDGGNFLPVYRICVYNNTVIENYISNTIGYNLSNTELDLAWFAVNNIVENYRYADYSPAFGIAVNWSRTCSRNYTWTNTKVDRNFIHNPQTSSYHFGLPDSYSCKTERWVSTSTFNSMFGFNNYMNSDIGLYMGNSGAEQYITDGNFKVSATETIETGGLGGPHPYLDGVTIPGYIGATEPGNSGWVQTVLNLSQLAVGSAPPKNEKPEIGK